MFNQFHVSITIMTKQTLSKVARLYNIKHLDWQIINIDRSRLWYRHAMYTWFKKNAFLYSKTDKIASTAIFIIHYSNLIVNLCVFFFNAFNISKFSHCGDFFLYLQPKSWLSAGIVLTNTKCLTVGLVLNTDLLIIVLSRLWIW